jgi:Fic family protein
MRSDAFQPGFPGRLTPISFSERSMGGTARSVVGTAFVPNPLPPTLDQVSFVGRLYSVLDHAKTSLLRLEAKIESLPSRTVLLAGMRMREAQASSKIENTVASLREIALAADDYADPSDESQTPPAVEVLRNRAAIEFGLRSKLPISIRLVRDMHRVLITDLKNRPGMFRDVQVCIGNENRGFDQARFVPPPHDMIDAAMRDWELFVNPGALNAPQRERLPELIELAMAHYQFETIHPFSDGNGRLGRALVNLGPVKSGLLNQPVCNLSEWVHENRRQYYDGLLRVSTHGDWEGWCRFFCTAIAEQSQLDLRRAERVAALYEKYQKLITQRRRSIMLTKLIDRLFEHQAISITSAAKVMGVSFTAANRHIDFLEKSGVLKRYASARRGSIFIAEGVLRAIRGQGED